MTVGTPYRIGLTGNIATGKSTVGEILLELGAMHIDADLVAHKVMEPQGQAYAAVIAAFGKAIVGPAGHIDRSALGDIVFDNPEALRRLEKIVHPHVIAAVNARIASSDRPVVVVEAIKLLESGLADTYEAIWVTTCPEPTQVSRLMTTRDYTQAEALRRVHAQPPQEEKIARADVVIDTSGTMAQTETQVRAAWAENVIALSIAR